MIKISSYKLIIVDDEKCAGEMLESCIGQLPLGLTSVGKFKNGLDALSFLRNNHVDIVITDVRMPKMDGLALAQQIFESMPHVKTIIVSGYSEFEYAKRAVEYNVFNYLLKPLNMHELSETLSRVISKLESEKADDYFKQSMLTKNREELFVDLIMGAFSDYQTFQKKFEELMFPFPISHSNGLFLSVQLKEEKSHSWKYGRERLREMLQNIIRSEFPDTYPVHIGTRAYGFLIIGNPLAQCCQHISKAISENLHIFATVSEETRFDNLWDLSDTNLLTRNLSDKLMLLMSHILLGNKDEAENILNNIIARNSMPECCPGAENEDIIEKAKKYINDNYNSDITRDDVASYVYLNSAYFSRYFKQKTGESFYDYLQGVRIRNAIRLLESNKKIQDICEEVGYYSLKHFHRIFKKYTSYSPNDYRKNVLMNKV